MFDNPKWLFFLLLGSVLVSLFVGFISLDAGTSTEAKVSGMETGFYGQVKTVMSSLAWDFDWLDGPMVYFGWIFRILNIGFGVLIVYQVVRIAQGFIP